MHLHFQGEPSVNANRFKRLGAWYAAALGVIAGVAIAGQVLIQAHLSDQLSDARIVNVAGKQRMLSQEISKTALKLAPGQPIEVRRRLLADLHESLTLWRRSHVALLAGDDSLQIPVQERPEVIALHAQTDPDFQAMSAAAEKVIHHLSNDPDISYDSLAADVDIILEHEGAFLSGMENLALWYANYAQQKVSSLSAKEYVLLAISLIVILLEVLFIFRPTARSINETVNQLVASEKNARKLSKEIGALYTSLEQSYEQVAMVNEPVENPRLYARADKGGNITFVSDNFKALSGDATLMTDKRISDLFEGLDDDWMDELIDTVSEGKYWQGQVKIRGAAGDVKWALVTITPVYDAEGEIEDLMVMGSDITQRKAAEQNMNRKNRAEIEKKINQQKFRSVLILEGQEEERNRIAMDIHDGIGQMLTSLKYQIESIDVKSDERAAEKIAEVDQLIKQVIREVRRVTFNLKPTVLGDYGLQAALNVFIQETGKLVDIKLVFNTSGGIDRLPQKIENNIFRIIQEAINNAIKYSEAEVIETTLARDDDNLVITVRDEGKGFDTRLVEARSVNIESGRGFFNMYERTEYVNGQLDIQSAPGRGTTVTLTVPMKNAVTLEV